MNLVTILITKAGYLYGIVSCQSSYLYKLTIHVKEPQQVLTFTSLDKLIFCLT